MKPFQALLTIPLLLLITTARAQLPANFSWINIESDKKVMPIVRRALHDNSITAIREVGVQGNYALVMTASREDGSPTPDYDLWTIYNIALDSGKSRVMANGYGVKIQDWIPLSGNELAMTYYDCWECEAATLFTTIHFVKGLGWQARWPNKSNETNSFKPGAVLLNADYGESEEEDRQIYAIVKQPNKSFAVGNWTQFRNDTTGKLEDDVERYFIDPATGQDRVERLTGKAAQDWERTLCTQSNILIQPSSGQDSRLCRAILKPPSRSIQQK